MSRNKSASLEARLKNSKDLIVSVKELSLYDPSSDEIKKENYEDFINMVEGQMNPYKNAMGRFSSSGNNAKLLFNRLKNVSRNIRSEIQELKGKNSYESGQITSVTNLITGQNVVAHARMKKKVFSNLKEGEQPPEFISVSELDYKSMVGNFRTLLGILRTFDFYNPTDNAISISALDALLTELNNSLEDIALKEAELANEKSKIAKYFDDRAGLKDRAVRAKEHVKRKYGIKSPEYKLLTKKIY